MNFQNHKLTENEFNAAMAFVEACLERMGGNRPSDLEDDPHTWVYADDLTDAGWSCAEARGTISALVKKDVIYEHEKNEWVLSEAAWRWLDTVWVGEPPVLSDVILALANSTLLPLKDSGLHMGFLGASDSALYAENVRIKESLYLVIIDDEQEMMEVYSERGLFEGTGATLQFAKVN